MSSNNKKKRVVSGIRSTGYNHLGHLHGALKNWVALQNEYECFYFAADWHALTTHYHDTANIKNSVWSCLTEWLACGVNPNLATVFVQSDVPEHAELHLLLSMLTPLSWLERVPTYKDQITKLSQLDLSTYGFLGYPVLQSADVLIYKADYIPVGEDQVPHIEITREIARRFNYIYGKEVDFEQKVQQAVKKMSKKDGKLYLDYHKKYQEQGDDSVLSLASELISQQNNLSVIDKERLNGYLVGFTKSILTEPEALLTKVCKMPGLDGQKMSKSYGNTISLREPLVDVEQKVKTMPTDPARVRRTDPGNPEKCPVWEFHKIYSTDDTKKWVQEGCTSAKIGCIDCKKPVIDSIKQEMEPIQDNIAKLEKNPDYVKDIVSDGARQAREVARITLDEVRSAMGLNYR